MIAAGAARADPALDLIVRKTIVRLLPLLFLGAVLASLDRANVGIAALQMNADIGLSASGYGFAVGAALIAYALFEVPSNIGLARVGARRWLARIMLTWGLVSTSTAFVIGPKTFVANRILLGMAEAGYLPGCIAFLSIWLPQQHRARVFSYFMVAVPISVVIGGPLSTLLLRLDGTLALRGWQWLFLLEGVPPVMLAVVLWRSLRDRPDAAEWLDTDEKARLAAAIGETASSHKSKWNGRDVGKAIARPVVLLFTLILACLGGINLAVTFWLPQIIKAAGITGVTIGWLTALPYATGAVAMLVWSRHSDRSGERRWHLAVPAVIGGASLVACAFVTGFPLRMGLLTLALTCVLSIQGIFWSAVSATLTGVDRTIGLAAINGGGTLISFFIPYVIGLSKQWTGGFDAAFQLLGAIGMLGGLLSILLFRYTAAPRAAPGVAAQ